MARRLARNNSGTMIWPGFVDAMTALLLVVMFMLSIFMVLLFIFREELSGQTLEVDRLTAQIAQISEELSVSQETTQRFRDQSAELAALLAQEREAAQELRDALNVRTEEGERLAAELAERLAALNLATTALAETESALDASQALAAALRDERDTAREALAEAETRSSENAAALATENERLRAELSTLREQNAALAARVEELGAETETLTAETGRLTTETRALAEEAARLETEAATLNAERQRLAAEAETLNAEAERLRQERAAAQSQAAEIRRRLAEAAAQVSEEPALTVAEQIAALELALQRRREEAEETLRLLAAAEARNAELSQEARAAAAETTEDELLAAYAQASLNAEREQNEQNRLAVALLNQQVRTLRQEIAALRLQLDAAEARDAESQIEIDTLGERLNRALAARVNELEQYRSEFFGRLRALLGDREGVRIVGDRFVFQAEVLFDSGSAELGPEGRAELARFAGILRELAADIPPDVDWILRVDGHTDVVPLGSASAFASNWELSQARALSVVTFLTEEQAFPPDRLAAAGFGEFQPIDAGTTRAAYARNRRIELKLTER